MGSGTGGGSPRSRKPKGVGQFSGATDDDEVVLMACLVNCCVFIVNIIRCRAADALQDSTISQPLVHPKGYYYRLYFSSSA